MGVLLGWGSTNRLVRRVRRHSAFATLFRSSLPAATGAMHSPPRLVMGRIGQVQTWDGHASSPPDAQVAALSGSTVQLSAEKSSGAVAVNVAAQTIGAPHAPTNAASPVRGQTVPLNPTAPVQLARVIQLANAPSDQITIDRGSSDADQSWRRLQRIRQLHEQKPLGTEAVPPETVTEVQRTPVKLHSSALPSIVPVATSLGELARSSASTSESMSAAHPASLADDTAQKMVAEPLSAPLSVRSNDPDDAVRSPTTANRTVQDQPVTASFTPSLDSPIVDPSSRQVSPSEIDNDLGQDVAHGGAVRRSAAQELSASVIQRSPGESTLTAAGELVAGASEQPPFDPAAPRTGEHESVAQRAPLEAAWPVVIDDSSADPVARSVVPVQGTSTAPKLTGDEGIDGSASDVIRQQVARIDTQVATDSKIDVITPRRSLPFMRKAPVALQPVPGQPEVAQAAPTPNLTQRSMVETEIGALPADLWRLIGAEAPVGNERKQPDASRRDERTGEAAPSIDVTVTQEGRQGPLPGIEASSPAERASEFMLGDGAKTLADDMVAGRSDIGQLASAQLAVAVGSAEQKGGLISEPEVPTGSSAPSSESPLPNVGDAKGESTVAQRERAIPPDVGAVPSFAAEQPPLINEATQESDLAGGKLPEWREPPQRKDPVSSVELPVASSFGNVPGRQPASVSIHSAVQSQTVQLAPIDTAQQGEGRVDVSGEELGESDAVGRQDQIDVDDLAQRVYRQLRRKLAFEWERIRPVHH